MTKALQHTPLNKMNYLLVVFLSGSSDKTQQFLKELKWEHLTKKEKIAEFILHVKKSGDIKIWSH